MTPETNSLWNLIADPDGFSGDPYLLRDQASRFADLVSPVLADWLLRLPSGTAALIDPARVSESRLIGRFNLSQHSLWVRRIAEAGFDPVYMKGFAAAHTIYPDPALRMQGDLDILVKQAQMDDLIAFLTGHGFAFRPMPVNPWGMISDASFFPFVSPDGHCDIDIHIRPDCFPAHRSLSTERVFASARRISIDGTEIAIPNPSHAFVLCITNTAKDKFGVFSLRKVIDAMIMLRDHPPPDWSEVQSLARDGGFMVPTRAFCCLLARLGVNTNGMPGDLVRPFTGIRASELDRVVTDFETLFPSEPGFSRLLWREWSVGAEPAVALHNLGLRLAGLVRPTGGVPKGAAVNKDFHVQGQ